MIHQLLNLTRPLFIFDTETTGVDPQKDRIIEFGFQQWGPEGLVKEYRTLINPRVPIPPGASAVHGIYDDDFKKCSVCGEFAEAHVDVHPDAEHAWKPHLTFAQLAPNLAKGMTNCDFGGKNIRFDVRITLAEMAREGVPWSIAGARIVDAERLEQLAIPRDLGSLHAKYVTEPCPNCVTLFEGKTDRALLTCEVCRGTGRVGRPHEGAHGALSDVQASTAVLVGQLTTWPNLPRDLDALHAAQWPGMIDLDRKFMFVNGVPCFSQWGKYAGRPMTVADNGYWDFILKNDFSSEVKALASAAKLGKYPEVKA